jgi:hypothetical protein
MQRDARVEAVNLEPRTVPQRRTPFDHDRPIVDVGRQHRDRLVDAVRPIDGGEQRQRQEPVALRRRNREIPPVRGELDAVDGVLEHQTTSTSASAC